MAKALTEIKMLSTALDNWLEEKKMQAKAAYEKEPLPDRTTHLWKYSNPNDFVLTADRSLATPKKQIHNPAEKELIVADIKVAFESYENLLKKCFGKLISKTSSKITLLNEAFWNSGYFVYVPKGKSVVNAIGIVSKLNKSESFYPVRNFVYLEESSEVKLDEFIHSEDINNSYSNIVTEIYLEKGSKLTYSVIQDHCNSITHHHIQRVSLSEDSEFSNTIVSIGAGKSKVDFDVNLNGKGSSASAYGIVLGNNKQSFDHHIAVSHNAPYTNSNVNFRVALKDKASSAYTGNLKIAHEAVKSDAHQENRNLLLSPNAKAESIPELEILTNDVTRCNHGVTVGQVDKDQIYYLMSRGLDEKAAEKIIVEGFLEPTISKILNEKLKQEVLEKINSKLEKL